MPHPQQPDEEGVLVIPLPVFQAFVPYMTKERFSELSGVELQVLENWIDRGYVPSKKIGKRRVLNLVHMLQDALDTDYS